MTLHSGRTTGEYEAGLNGAGTRDPHVVFEQAETLGDGFRAVREVSGRSLHELSAVTRVHPKHLSALEENNFSALPSRVFAIGYARGYAQALGLDDQTAVERFKRESPDGTVPLQAPTGIAFEDVRRHSPIVIGCVVAVAVAVVGWNVFQRISQTRAPQLSTIEALPATWAASDPAGTDAAVSLGAPQPAPPDQTTPALYITPGLEAQLTGIDPADPAAIAAAAAATPPVQAAFNPRGAVYGASATASQVVVQANRAANLVVSAADGRVLFARQLASGEAWRAPLNVAGVVDVSEPTAFDVYLNGEHGGALEATRTPLAQLNARAQTLARQTAAAIEATRQAAVRAQAEAAAAAALAAPPAVRTPPPMR